MTKTSLYRSQAYRLRAVIYRQYNFCVRHDKVVVDKDRPLPFTGLQDTGCVIIYCDDACAFKKRSDKKVKGLQDLRRHKKEKV
ncbi:hypothetical protein TSAR_000593 [Trichomalopsis sarcophagae]|uniref:Uncharacterized protein n=1 Tax=Trichomalopsis sarcophagae TaxID=543379 RepID=A0A232EF24_9HYME|nr:hypothetical protein TSAR_000593 [Trichomalopsis sarcophagae]